MYDGAPLSGLGPIVNTLVNASQRIWDAHDPITPSNPEDEEDQFGPDGTPRAAIQGRRPRRNSESSQQESRGLAGSGSRSGGVPVAFPPLPVTARTDLRSSSYNVLEPIAEYISSDEGDFEAHSLIGEDRGWIYVDARQQVDGKSGLSVPMMKEDPRYERDRRRKIESMGKESGFAKVSKKVVGMFGYGSPPTHQEEEGMKRMKNERKAREQAPARRRSEVVNSGVERSGGTTKPASSGEARSARSARGGRDSADQDDRYSARDVQTTDAGLQVRPRGTVFSIEEEIASAMSSSMGSTMESVRSADSRHSTLSASRKKAEKGPRTSPRQARVNDEEQVARPPRHPDTPRPRHLTSSGIPDNTVSWRRSRIAEVGKEQTLQTSDGHQGRPRTKRHAALDFAPQAQTPGPKEEASENKPKPRPVSHEPSFSAGDGPLFGQPVTNQPRGLQNIPYRERSRSLDSAKWSSHDSESDNESRNFIVKVNQVAPKDDAGWRIPPIGSKKATEKEEKTQKRNLQPTVENVKDEGSVYDPPTFNSNGLFDAVSRNMTEREKEQYGVNTAEDEFARSERFTTFSEKDVAQARKGKKKVESKRESDDDDDEFFDEED